jgi:hypothetical protein
MSASKIHLSEAVAALAARIAAKDKAGNEILIVSSPSRVASAAAAGTHYRGPEDPGRAGSGGPGSGPGSALAQGP